MNSQRAQIKIFDNKIQFTMNEETDSHNIDFFIKEQVESWIKTFSDRTNSKNIEILFKGEVIHAYLN